MAEKYSYHGAVLLFGKPVASITAFTWATSEQKAAANIIYNFKKKNGYQATAKFTLAEKPVSVFQQQQKTA